MLTLAADDAAAVTPGGHAAAAAVHARLGAPHAARTLAATPAAVLDELLRLPAPLLAFTFLLLTLVGCA